MASYRIATGWQLYLGSLALGSVAICAVALLATWLLRRHSAPARHGLLLAALSLTALSPALVGLALVLDWGWRVDVDASRNVFTESLEDDVSSTVGTPIAIGSAPAVAPPNAASEPRAGEPAPAGNATPDFVSPYPSPITLIDSPRALPILWLVLALVWGLGTTVCLARLARGISILARLRRSLVVPADGRLAVQLRESLERLDTRRRAQVGESSLAPAPLSFGLLRPVIVMPIALSKELDDEQLRLVLAHEAAHVARRDHCVALVERLAAALFWWNLLLRRVNHRLGQLREEICDDYAADGSLQRRRLAEVLVKIAGWSPPVPVRIEGATALVDDARDSLAARVGRLVEAWPRSIRLSRRAAVGVAAFGLALAGVVVMSTLRAEDGAATRKTERPAEGQALVTELRQRGISLVEDPFTGAWNVHVLGSGAGDDAIAKIERIGKIGDLNLTSDELTNACLEYVGRMTDLTKLAINAGSISDQGLAHLTGLDKLEELSISSPRVTDAGLEHLKDLPHLARVTLLGVNVSNAGLRHLQDYPALVDLNVSGSRRRISDEGMRYLANAPRLANLTISSDQVTDEGLRSLSASASVVRLSLQGEGFSDEGLRALAGLSSLRDLTVTSKRISAEGIKYLKSASGLESLGLYRCPQLNDDSLVAVGELTQLRRLALGGEAMTDAGLANLSALAGLQNLILTGSKFTGDGLKHLSGCPELTNIDARGDRIGDELFLHLNQFPKLRVLHVGAEHPTNHPRVTNAGLARLQSASLEYIFCFGTGITDAGLAALDTLPNLKSAHFAWTPGVANAIWQRNQQIPPAPAVLNPNAVADGRVHESGFFDREQAAIWFCREGHESEVAFVLYHYGFLQTGLAYTQYEDSWNYKGHVHILDKRKLSLEYQSDDPNTIVLDGKSFDAQNGRVIVLDVVGDPVQLALAPPTARQENLAELGRKIAETRAGATATTDREAIIAELKSSFGPLAGAPLDVRPGHEVAAAPDREGPRAAADGDGDVAEADLAELALTIALEDDAREPLKFVLLDTYSRPKKTWENVAPGSVRLELPELESDRYLLEISAAGYGKRHLEVKVSKEGISANAEALELYRRRYAVLRYVANMQGERQLTGPNVKEGRVAISYGSVPDLHGDWLIRQDKASPVFSLHRFQAGNGFARPPAGAEFEDIDLAPQPDQYKAEIIAAEKGMVLLNHIIGDGPRWRRYAKILVEDVTETPPKDIQIIDTLLPPTFAKARPAAKTADPASDRTSGQVTTTVSLEDDARGPVKLELRDNFGQTLKVWKNGKPGEIRITLPELEHDRYSLTASAEGYSPVRTEIKVSDTGVEPAQARFELYRIRYLVLRYVMNTKGERNLTGANVEGGRVAVLFGKIPELQDWSVDQRDGQLKVIVHRVLHNTGFAPAAEGKSFDQLDMAPPTEDYSPDEFTFEKGMILFNRVVGHRPEFARYAKLIVEDITETRPENLAIIDSRPK